MSTKILNESEPFPETRLPAPSGTFGPSPEDHPTQSADGLMFDSEVSRILIVDDDPGIQEIGRPDP